MTVRQEKRAVYRYPAWVFDTSNPDDAEDIVTIAVVRTSGEEIGVYDESSGPYPYSETLVLLSRPGARLLAQALLDALDTDG